MERTRTMTLWCMLWTFQSITPTTNNRPRGGFEGRSKLVIKPMLILDSNSWRPVTCKRHTSQLTYPYTNCIDSSSINPHAHPTQPKRSLKNPASPLLSRSNFHVQDNPSCSLKTPRPPRHEPNHKNHTPTQHPNTRESHASKPTHGNDTSISPPSKTQTTSPHSILDPKSQTYLNPAQPSHQQTPPR